MAPIRRLVAAAALAAVGPLACAKTEKSNNPLSPEIAGPIPWVEIAAPTLMEPGRDWRIKTNEQPIQLLIENADTNGPRPLVYRFEIATDAGFRTLVFARDGVPQGNGGQTGRTAFRLPDRLQDGRTYFWRARAYDGANSGPFSSGINFQIQFPPRIFDPVPVDPVNGQTAAGNPPHLRVRNSTKQGPVLPVNYAFQVSPNPSFTPIVAQGAMPEGAAETVYLPTAALQWGATYYWRVAAGDGQVNSSWAVASFRTPNPAPGPGPGPTPGPPPGGPCAGSEIDIVTCRRAPFGPTVSPSEAPSLLRGIAQDLNRGMSTPRYGILRKTTGNNCGGFSCDIICSRDGQHWDVLIAGPDASTGFSGPSHPTWHNVGSVDPSRCQIIP
jgi:hypothetical protein